MGNTFSRHHRNRDHQHQVPPSGVPTSVSTSQTHEDDASTQSRTYQSKITVTETKIIWDSMVSFFFLVEKLLVDLSCVVIVIQYGLCDLYYVGVSDRNAQL